MGVIALNTLVNFESRCIIKYELHLRKPPYFSIRFFAICSSLLPLGLVMIPAVHSAPPRHSQYHTRSTIFGSTLSLPSLFLMCVHFLAISVRCLASSVSGVSSVSTSVSICRPSFLAFTANDILCLSVNRIR